MNFIFFQKPNEENGYLSNWYLSDFVVNNIHFSSMEQYMIYQKAIYFKDTNTAENILKISDVSQIKALGRLVKDYDDNR